MIRKAEFEVPTQALEKLCRRWRVTELSLFGSAARGDVDIKSDVDLLVTFDEEAHWTLLDMADLQDELSDLFGRPADVVTRRMQSAILRAPMAGYVSVLKVRQGDVVAPGQLIVRVTDPRRVAIRFAVPAEQDDEVRVGQEIKFVAGDLRVTAKIRELTRDLEPPLQLIVGEADLDESTNTRAQPGLVGTVELEL